MKTMHRAICTAWLVLTASFLTPGVAAPPFGPTQGRPEKATGFNVMAGGYYVREVNDQEWHVIIRGQIPSVCGAYLIVHDEKGRAVWHGVIPRGTYPEEKPYVITVKPDGVTGDYAIIMVGHQDDKLGVLTPWTDLPYEVYGNGSMSMGHDPRAKPFFKAPEGVARMHLGAYKGQFRVLDEQGNVVADSKVSGKLQGKYDNAVEFDVTPGKTYIFERQCMYFRSYIPDTFYFTFDAARWFKPSAELDKVKWWEIPLQ